MGTGVGTIPLGHAVGSCINGHPHIPSLLFWAMGQLGIGLVSDSIPITAALQLYYKPPFTLL